MLLYKARWHDLAPLYILLTESIATAGSQSQIVGFRLLDTLLGF
jgi:hypothetical protein